MTDDQVLKSRQPKEAEWALNLSWDEAFIFLNERCIHRTVKDDIDG